MLFKKILKFSFFQFVSVLLEKCFKRIHITHKTNDWLLKSSSVPNNLKINCLKVKNHKTLFSI